MAVVLRRYEELSYEEIAEILDLSVPAVKSLLFRARTELRERRRVISRNKQRGRTSYEHPPPLNPTSANF